MTALRIQRPAGPYLMVAAASLLLWLCFPPLSLWPLALVSLIPLLFALRDAAPRRVFWLSWLFGALFNAGLLHWIVFNPAVEAWVRPLLYLGVALIAAYLGLFIAAAAATARWLARRTGAPLWLLLPLTWTLADFVRSQGVLGFPWGCIGYAVTPWLPAIQTAELASVWGVAFWVVLANGAIYWITGIVFTAVRARQSLSQRRVLALVALLLALLAPLFYGQLRLRQIGRACAVAPRIKVSLIQGNIEQGMRWDREFVDYNWRTYRDLSRKAAADTSALIVWPETAMPFYLRYQGDYLSQMVALTGVTRTPILTGVPDYQRDYAENITRYYNSSFLFVPGRGLAGQYAKAHLAPFGERFPLKDKIPYLRNVNFGEGEWTPGTDTLPFYLDTLRFANLICFESIFPGITRAWLRRGAAFFVVITNDGWFGRSGAARQHADMATVRAVETRRAIARCANSGISMLIMPTGRVVRPTPLYQQVILTGAIPLLGGMTFYGRYGDIFILMLAIGLAVLLALALLRRR